MRFISDAYWDRGMRDGNQDSISLQEVRMKGKMVDLRLSAMESADWSRGKRPAALWRKK